MISTDSLPSTLRRLPGRLLEAVQQEDEFPRVDVRRIVLGTVGLAIVLGAIGILVNAAVASALVVIGLATWLWRAPVRGLYLMAGCCALVQQFPLGFPDSLTDRIPLWRNLDSSGSGVPLGLSPFDIILGSLFVITALRGLFAGRLRLSFGRLTVPYYLYGAVLLFGVGNGLLTGGSLNLALWALRPQFYGVLVFVLTCALVRERRQLMTIGIVFLTTELVTGILGDWRFLITLQRNLGSADSLLAHEDSYFLLLFIVATGIGLVWWRGRRVWLFLLLLAPIPALALVENNRRTGIDAAAITFILFLVLIIRYRPDVRKWAILIGGTVAGGYAVIVAASWNVQYGTRAALVSPVRSIIGQPSARDLSSDAYRIAENANLAFTFHLSPFTGWGLGKDFLEPVSMANIADYDSLYLLIPHNTLLWVPMALGIFGMITFWALVGLSLMESVRAIGLPGDRLVQGAGVFCACAIVAELVFAYADQQLMNPRNMVTFGILLGIANVAPRLAARRKGAAPLKELQDGD